MESLEGVGRMDNIPGLPASDDLKGKKGKKKAPAKNKTLSLQTFLQDENQETGDSEENSEVGTINLEFGNLKLSDEELAVMESCHSFIYDLLKQLGPCNAMDPLLQTEINNFPPEAKSVIKKCGGYRDFILQSKDLIVVDKILCAKPHFDAGLDLGIKEIFTRAHNGSGPHEDSSYSGTLQNHETYDSSRPPHEPPRNPLIDKSNLPHLPPQKPVKDIWNSKQNSGLWNHNNSQHEAESNGGIWGSNSNSNQHNSSESFPLQLPSYEGSLFNEGSDSYSVAKNARNNRDSEFSVEDNEPHGLLGGPWGSNYTQSSFSSSFASKGGSSALSDLAKNGTSDKKSPDECNGESAAQRLMKGFCSDGLFSSDNVSGSNTRFEESQQRKSAIIEDFQDRIWKLTSHNNDLLKQLADKEQDVAKLSKDLLDLKAKYATLESEHQRMSAEMGAINIENQTLKAQVSLRPDSSSNSSQSNGEVQSDASPELKTNSDRELIWSLQKQLEMEQLRTRNLTQELQIQRDEASRKAIPPGLINNPRSLTRQAGSVPMLGLGLPGLDDDPFGLRRMMQNGPMHNTTMPPLSRQNSMFGPLVGPEFSVTSHPINKSASSLGLNLGSGSEPIRGGLGNCPTGSRSSHTPSPAGSISPVPALSFPSTNFPAPSFPGSAFSAAPSYNGPVPPTNQSSFAKPSQFFSQPPPPPPQAAIGTTAPTPSVVTAAPPPPLQTAGTIGSISGTAVSGPQTTKIAREQQLVKKLVAALPGTTDDKVRQYIQVLRSKTKNGKLSGLATSEIATQIAELIKNENSGHL